MTKKIIISLFIIFATATSYAANKCVALGAAASCEYGDPAGSQSDWSSNCSLDGNSIKVRGVATCGHNGHPDLVAGKIMDSVEFANNASWNVACFCKIVQPVTSHWVYAQQYGDANTLGCTTDCAKACSGMMSGDSTFRTSILSVLFE